MAASPSSKIRLFSTDLDGTLLGNPESTQRFVTAWETLTEQERPLLVFNSGRLVGDMQNLVKEGKLPEPDFYIGGVGTQIFDPKTGRYFDAWTDELNRDWDRARVQALLAEETDTSPQPEHYQNAHKSSWYLRHASPQRIAAIESLIADAGVHATLVYSSARDLDILAEAANKGKALRWLCKHVGVPLSSHPEVDMVSFTGSTRAGVEVAKNAAPTVW